MADRIKELTTANSVPDRPPYIHQVPLDFLPGLGPKTMAKLLDHFGTEMNILHNVPKEEIEKLVKMDLAELIIKARNGDLQLSAGGGGQYGKVSDKQ